jgi:hypothetical protein
LATPSFCARSRSYRKAASARVHSLVG